jgi:prevent-host-death family protein
MIRFPVSNLVATPEQTETGAINAGGGDGQDEVRDEIRTFERDACCDIATHRLSDERARSIEFRHDQAHEVIETVHAWIGGNVSEPGQSSDTPPTPCSRSAIGFQNDPRADVPGRNIGFVGTTNPSYVDGQAAAANKRCTTIRQCCTVHDMRPVVGVAEARAQLSEIVAQAALNGQVTVIERYGKPAAAVIPFEALESLQESIEASDTSVGSKPSARARQAQLLDALARLQEAVEMQTPEDADLVYEALNTPYQASRGRRLER